MEAAISQIRIKSFMFRICCENYLHLLAAVFAIYMLLVGNLHGANVVVLRAAALRASRAFHCFLIYHTTTDAQPVMIRLATAPYVEVAKPI